MAFSKLPEWKNSRSPRILSKRTTPVSQVKDCLHGRARRMGETWKGHAFIQVDAAVDMAENVIGPAGKRSFTSAGFFSTGCQCVGLKNKPDSSNN